MKKTSSRAHGRTCRPCRTCFSNADCAGLMRRKRENVRYHNPFRERKVGMSRIRWCVQLSCKDDWKNARVPWFDENIDVDKKNIEKKRWLFWLGRLCLLHSDVAQYYNGHRDAFFEHHEPHIFNIVDHANKLQYHEWTPWTKVLIYLFQLNLTTGFLFEAT